MTPLKLFNFFSLFLSEGEGGGVNECPDGSRPCLPKCFLILSGSGDLSGSSTTLRHIYLDFDNIVGQLTSLDGLLTTKCPEVPV